ncbi:MAG TPA: hypothetical protein VGK85_05935 [Myxococcaceae bacterium]
MPGAGLGSRLAEELSRYLSADVLGPLSASDTLTSPRLADRALRGLLPRALEGRGATEAASRIRALPEITGTDVARTAQPALERIARATQAPPDLIRAAAQASGSLLMLEIPGAEQTGSVQLVSAVARLALAAIRSGIAASDVIALLAS